MGAIIVFERDAALEEFVDDATRIDAALSRQLLVSLFVPARDNELHDGAVVINGKTHRIELARALLPLSRATDLGPEFGTRHRAALGITEDTDAVVVVVSEERGEISLCFKGSIARDLEPVILRRALVGLFAGGRATDRWPRRPRPRPRSARRSRASPRHAAPSRCRRRRGEEAQRDDRSARPCTRPPGSRVDRAAARSATAAGREGGGAPLAARRVLREPRAQVPVDGPRRDRVPARQRRQGPRDHRARRGARTCCPTTRS